MLQKIWLIPLLPVTGALVQLLFGRKLKHAAVSAVSVGLTGISFAWAFGCFFELLGKADHTFLLPIYTSRRTTIQIHHVGYESIGDQHRPRL